MEAGVSASAAAEQLLSHTREYKSGVSSLLDALERNAYLAAERCWRRQDRSVQLRGGLIRSKNVVLQEATFLPEIEQHELGGALDQWRDAVKSVAAAAALQVGVAEQHLLAAVGRVLEQQEPAASAEQLLGLLGTLLSTHDALLSLNQRDLRRTLGLLGQLAAQVAAAWRRAGGTSPNDLLAAHATAPQEVIALLTAPGEAAEGAAGVAPGLSPEQAASLAALQERQRALLEELSDAADVLRFWGRRSEKVAAGASAAGREGDVPPMLTQAQQLLWAASQAYDEEQAVADLRTRQLVCQRYKPADLPALQARADDFAGGERLPAQQNLMFEPEFVELRGQARALAARFVQEKGIAKAAEQLHQLRYLLLEAALPPETAPARQQLLLRVAEALLDGSTPPAAAPLLVGWLQEGLQRAEGGGGQEGGQAQGQMSDQERARLVPMVCGGVAEPPGGGRAVLRKEEGAALLRSLLRPEGMLDAGQLDQCASTLKLVLDTCTSAGVSAEAAESLLSVFDASRLAVLACERAAAPDAPPGGAAGLQALLSLAHAALGHPGGEACGLGLLEGVLALQPAAYFAATLQLALARGSGGGGQRLLSMLCRVPVEMLPPAVVGDAFIQLAEALDGGTLAPPFLPHDLMGRLLRTPCVLHSMCALVERGHEAAAAEAAGEAAPAGQGQQLWTARIGVGHASLEGGGPGSGEEHIAGGSSAAQAEGGAPAAEGPRLGAAAAAEAEARAGGGAADAGGGHSLLLLPLQASPEPLAALLERLVGAALSCLLRRAGGAIDATTVSEEVSALLEALLLPAAEQGAWMLQWLWQCLYQDLLRDFLRDLCPVDAGSAQLAAGAFRSYWASLPWQQASFHAASPATLATLRLHLVAAAGDGAAAALLGRLDFTPVLAKAVPPAKTTPRERDQVYSLADEEDEEEDLLQAGPAGSGAWAAELGLLALQACVLLPAADQPAWVRQLLFGMRAHTPQTPGGAGGEEEASVQALMQRSALSATMSQLLAAAGEHQPLLPALLAGADWRRLAVVMHAEQATAGGAVPWLLLAALLAGDSLAGGDLGSRLVHSASLLSRGAVLAGTPHAAETAAGAAGALMLCTLCQGARHAQHAAPVAAAGRDASAAEDAAMAAAMAESARLAQQEQVVIPEGFPRELLEDTVEGQQLLLLQQQQEEQRQLAAQRAAQQGEVPAAAADTAAAEVASPGGQQHEQHRAHQEQGGQQQEIVEVRGCWSLTPGQHVALLQQALLPLAAARATNDAAGAWQQEDCPPELAASSGTAALCEWHAPHLPDLLQAAAATAAAEPDGSEAAGEAAAGAAATACVAALLLPLVRPPVTVLLQDSLAFANSELPLDTEGAVFVSVGPEAGRGSGGAGGADAGVVRSQLLVAVQAACKQPGSDALAACLLRLLCACPALHASATAMLLSEGLLCFLAAPEQDGGPLGQGAAAAAGAGAETVVASPGMLPAITASQGLPPGTLLGLAESAAQLHAPLTAALAVERLRQGSTVLPKDEWQVQTTRVLQVALQAEAGPAHPFDLVAVWLAALAWVADPRWRRLTTVPHHAALMAWLEALELRVVALQLAQPEDFALEGSGSTARRLLSGAADRFKAMRQHMPRLGPSQGHGQPDAGEHAGPADASALPAEPAAAGPGAAGGLPGRGSPGGKEGQLGQRLSSGFRSLLGKAGSKPADAASSDAAGGPEPESQAAGERRKWGDKVRSRLARMGLGGKGEQQGGEQHLHMAGEAGEGLAVPGSMPQAVPLPAGGHAYPGPGLVTVAEEGGSFSAESSLALHGTPGDVGHLGSPAGSSTVEAGAGGAGGSERTGAVQRLSSSLQAVGRGLSGGLSRVKEKLSDSHSQGPRPDELAEHDRDVACRIGLAAFAVSAYIKSVLCPSLTPRPGADTSGPSTPTSARPPAEGFPPGPLTATQRYYHRTRSSFGSMQLDAEYMRELDRLIEARTELDALDSLAACPLLQRHPGRYQAFLAEAPQLLSAGTGVEAFQRRLQQLLFPGERQLAALA
ncbi:hypothetical protein ABPG75_009754 [Micractinium tetrahymenae]